MSDELVAVVYNGPIAVADVRLPDNTFAQFEREVPIELSKEAADHVLTNSDFALAAKPKKTPRAGEEALTNG